MSNYYILIDSDEPLAQLRARIARTLSLDMDAELERRWPGFFGVTEHASVLLRHNPFADQRSIKFARYRDILCIYPLALEDGYGREAFEALKQLRCPMALLRGLNEKVATFEPVSAPLSPHTVQIGAALRRGQIPPALEHMRQA